MDHEDVIFNILLQADIHDIKNLSLVNKKNYSVSNNIHFWHTKFKQDQLTLPILIQLYLIGYKYINLLVV